MLYEFSLDFRGSGEPAGTPMRIKRIEITGFKSFCERTILDFSEPITAVVGPNGCGKSNIVDAIRWCMGEQSAKHLRGKAMDDVIFAGSETRGPAGLAEVSLTFENVRSGGGPAGPSAAEADALESSAKAERAAAWAAGADDDAAAATGHELGGAGEGAERGEAGAEARPEAGAKAEPASPGGEDSADDLLREAASPAVDVSQYAEVTISRRLFRDGSSGYFINKTPCRLRDITDFFLGTGIGTKAYSIIEQGRIGMIVSARPQDRRALIEEAAGITKFKTKKRSAERKLEQTRHNLLRVSDVVAELEKRLGSLRRQAQKAERYRRYKAEIKDIELWSASQAFLGKAAQEKVCAGALAAASEELAQVREKLESRDAKVVAERTALAAEERHLSSLQEALYELENRIKLSESRADYQRREAAELDERVSSARGEIRGVKARQEEAAAELEERRAGLDSTARRVRESEDALADQEAAAREARESLGERQRELEAARAEIAEARAELARAESRREAAARRRAEGGARLDRITGEREHVGAELRRLSGDAARMEDQLGEVKAARVELAERIQRLENRKRELDEGLESAEAEVETLRTERHRRASRLQSLVEIHKRYEGFAQGTRTVMQNADAAAGGSSEHIRGLVADVVEAPEQLEAAVEAALGDRLGGVLVSDHRVGVKAVDYLKSTASGRSAFIPVTPSLAAQSGSIAFEDRSGGGGAGAAGGDGIVGHMVDLVGAREGYDGVARHLLKDVVVVDTLDRAVELHRRGTPELIVTLDGDVLDDRGVVSGGSRDGQSASVLAQKREIRELEEITEGLDRDLESATERLTATKRELQGIERALTETRAEKQEREIELTSLEKDASRVSGEREAAEKRQAELDRERGELEALIAEAAGEEGDASERLSSATARIDLREGQVSELVQAAEEGKARVDALEKQLTEAKVQAAELREKKASAEAAIRQLESARDELTQRLERLEASITGDSERAGSLREQASAATADLEKLREDHRARAETLREGRSAYDQKSMEIGEMEAELRELRSRAEALSADCSKHEVELSKLREGKRHLEESIADRYQLRLVDCLTDYHLRPQVGDQEETRLAELRRLIERMGADINLTAIEEYEDISKRHEFLSTQREDLEGAVSQLEEAIQKINRTSRRLFRDTFDAVNRQFQDVFPSLFKGGQAKLSLSGASDGDILDAGVEIFAQPPGKKNTAVDQLSGGEKALTAVALIFAIFLIKPSPFCLLDEVDAPLDDVNVDRYRELVREMTDRSQFIVITHNKRTMEIADRLYGVTMQEPGVSNLVSVNLNKLDGQIAA